MWTRLYLETEWVIVIFFIIVEYVSLLFTMWCSCPFICIKYYFSQEPLWFTPKDTIIYYPSPPSPADKGNLVVTLTLLLIILFISILSVLAKWYYPISATAELYHPVDFRYLFLGSIPYYNPSLQMTVTLSFSMMAVPI